MQHAYTTPDYPAHWDEEDPDPVESMMVFVHERTAYRVYGYWLGDDWDSAAKMYLLDDDGNELEPVDSVELWNAATECMTKRTYEDLEEI